MQEEREKRDLVKKLEKEFVEETERTIRDVFKRILFEHHKKIVKRIAECYNKSQTEQTNDGEGNKRDVLSEQACVDKQIKSMKTLENRVDKYLHMHQEGVQNCLSACVSNVYTPVSDCYQECFEAFTHHIKQPRKEFL